MRMRLVCVLGLATALSVTGMAFAANTQKIGGKFSPSKAPKDRLIPGTLRVITTAGSTETGPRAVKPAIRARIFFDDDGTIFVKGIPTCDAARIQGTTTAEAKAECGPAQVGGGTAKAALGGDPANQVNVVVTAFNGKPKSGKPTTLLHSRTESLGFTTVLTGVLFNVSGDFGKMLDVNVPPLPLDAALTKFDTTVRKVYRYQGKRRSYVSIACRDKDRTWDIKGAFNYNGNPQLTASTKQKCTVKR